MHFEQNEYFSPFEFSSAGINIDIWIINSAGLNNLSRSALIRIRFGSWKVQRNIFPEGKYCTLKTIQVLI